MDCQSPSASGKGRELQGGMLQMVDLQVTLLLLVIVASLTSAAFSSSSTTATSTSSSSKAKTTTHIWKGSVNQVALKS